MNRTILLAEDDPENLEIVKMYLTSEGYEVLAAGDGEEALTLFRNHEVHLVISDLMMPGMDGYELIRTLRKETAVPIIIISARTSDTDKVLGLNIGADAYITKPFNPMEAVAYVNAVLRRYFELGGAGKSEAPERRSTGENLLVNGELELDTEKMELRKRGNIIFLTPAELKILMHLMKFPGRIFTKTQLYECVNGEYFENTENTMMVHIANLRSKIEDDSSEPVYIKTVRGLGYKMEKL